MLKRVQHDGKDGMEPAARHLIRHRCEEPPATRQAMDLRPGLLPPAQGRGRNDDEKIEKTKSKFRTNK
jgi:hypothetical protein